MLTMHSFIFCCPLFLGLKTIENIVSDDYCCVLHCTHILQFLTHDWLTDWPMHTKIVWQGLPTSNIQAWEDILQLLNGNHYFNLPPFRTNANFSGSTRLGQSCPNRWAKVTPWCSEKKISKITQIGIFSFGYSERRLKLQKIWWVTIVNP